MDAVRSKSTQFVERLSRAEFINTRLWAVCIAICCVCVILSISLVYTMARPKSIYYIPGVWQAGVAVPANNSIETVSAFVAAWLLNWNNFNPITSQAVFERTQRFMSPSLFTQTKLRLVKDLEEIKRSNISSMFTLESDPIVNVKSKGFIVHVKGVKVMYMGKEAVKEQQLTFLITVRIVGPTSSNPYGLLIEAIEQEHAS